MIQRENVLRDAMSLAPEDRLFLADVLEQSLSPAGGFADSEIAIAWTEELDRRIAAYEHDEIHAATSETTVSRLRKQLAEHRARKAGS